MTLSDMKPCIRQLLAILDFLHNVAGVVHTGISLPNHVLPIYDLNPKTDLGWGIDLQLKNLLLPAPDEEALTDFEEKQFISP